MMHGTRPKVVVMPPEAVDGTVAGNARVRDYLIIRAPTTTRTRLTVAEIQRAVCDHYGLPLGEMVSRRQSTSVVRPRQVAMWLAKMLTPMSLPEIGRRFGGRDHSTVIHGVARVKQLILSDATIRADVKAIRDILAPGHRGHADD